MNHPCRGESKSASLGLAGVTLGAVMLIAASPAAALYKTVGPDGRAVYSDRPLDGHSVAQSTSEQSAGALANLPYELRGVASRYPVTLYTAKGCAPCDSARSFLKQRGVPFQERTADTNADVQALQASEGSSQLPVVHIGSQRLKGYLESDWTSYLDAAGYPKTSQLPSGYQYPAAQPLVPTASSTPPNPSAATPTAPPAAPPSNGNTPPGFRF